eukprot:CAMPEP_0174856714 /NCGR_PEP_ID=MMETSP1114-20130205/36180_1 /TAXON_ID=312471 /ORGANISM="Neobodo designis, Strain CCAP 1951/1" /LENGTH=333 /DNA_ID=CAMNT_0016091519 /DNA_START=29 /DNA_END=1030 /DNA_ORIENTATION=-
MSGSPVQTFAMGTAACAVFVALAATSQTYIVPAFDEYFGREGPVWEYFNCGPTMTTSIGMLSLFLPTAVYFATAWGYMVADLWIERKGRYASPPKLPHTGFKPTLDHGKYQQAIWQSFKMTSISCVIQVVYFVPLNRLWNGSDAICNGQEGWFEAFPEWNDPAAIAVFAAATTARLFGLMLLTDAWFFFTHRMCHQVPFLYKHVHKLHHTWVEPYAVSATAAHPFEQFLVNMHTVNLPCILLGAPWRWYLLWFCLAMVNTCTSHSGFDLRFIFGFDGNVAHDRHHHYQRSEFGTNFLCDRIFGTRFQDVYTQDGRRRELGARTAKPQRVPTAG